MDEKFVYAYSADDKDYLLSKGFVLIKCDETHNRYLFENKSSYSFSHEEAVGRMIVFSNTMTF